MEVTHFVCEYEFEDFQNTQKIVKGPLRTLSNERKNYDINYLLYYQNKEVLLK